MLSAERDHHTGLERRVRRIDCLTTLRRMIIMPTTDPAVGPEAVQVLPHSPPPHPRATPCSTARVSPQPHPNNWRRNPTQTSPRYSAARPSSCNRTPGLTRGPCSPSCIPTSSSSAPSAASGTSPRSWPASTPRGSTPHSRTRPDWRPTSLWSPTSPTTPHVRRADGPRSGDPSQRPRLAPAFPPGDSQSRWGSRRHLRGSW